MCDTVDPVVPEGRGPSFVEKGNGMGPILAIIRQCNQVKNYVDINILT